MMAMFGYIPDEPCNCGNALFTITRGTSTKYTNKDKTEGYQSSRYIRTCFSCGTKVYEPIYTDRHFRIIKSQGE